ncbi:carboxylesterase/lipase family protein, partial [Staphylococcus lugdunensis]
ILQLDSAETGMMKAQYFDDLMQQHFSGKSINDLDDQAILQLMAYEEKARGKSKGLELIYQPIKDSKMYRPLSEFNKPIVLSYTK